MIRSAECPFKNKDIAAPVLIDLFPICFGPNPKASWPPPDLHTSLRSLMVYFWVIRVVLISDPDTVHKGVLLFLRFTNLRTRCTALANRMTGHNTLSPVLRCDRRSNFSPFFWFKNVILTYIAMSMRWG